MYALVEILGKQYMALVGATLQVDKLSMEEGAALELDKVLALVDENSAKFGTPYVSGAKVLATVEGEMKGDKIKVYKFHRRKGYRRTQGHRQQYSSSRSMRSSLRSSEMAHKKGGGSSRNGRDSNSQRLGVKRFGGRS